MSGIFLTANWQKLIMANYKVQPEILQKYIPAHTELDLWNGECYISLVAFMFTDTEVKGIKVPWHTNFEEVNLRFYVKQKMGDKQWRRGVTFINEIVPRWAIAKTANWIYKENYRRCPMEHVWTKFHGVSQYAGYEWKLKNEWYTLSVDAGLEALSLEPGSEEEFIAEHYWGYTKASKSKTIAYQVEHPQWKHYKVNSYKIDVDFAKLYGPAFGFLSRMRPCSVFICQGSKVTVRKGERIKGE